MQITITITLDQDDDRTDEDVVEYYSEDSAELLNCKWDIRRPMLFVDCVESR